MTGSGVRASPGEFGQLLQRYRVAAGLTQEELAEEAGLSVRGISDLERGIKRHPRPYTARQLADALHLTPIDRAVFLQVAHGEQIPAEPADPAGTQALPVPPTPFIGRVEEVAAVRELLLEEHVRLLTLTGAGGSGKTRLAIEVARGLVHAFPDGVVFVPLAPLADPAMVTSTTARALGLKEPPGNSILQTLVRSLCGKHILLVLDNFEHVMDAAGEVVALVKACPNLTVLVTSRAPLHLAAEREYPVMPLPFPDPIQIRSAGQAKESDAVRLFVDRVQQVEPDFQLTDENVRSVTEICHRLDGLPLALELAATRIRVFTPETLAHRLNQSLPLLVGGPRDVPARQQTLRATIDWSYQLLTEEEQRLFARLSIFAGGWTLNAAEAVCTADHDIDVLTCMGTLVEHHLIQPDGGMEPRFLMLQTIREYASDRVHERGESELLRRRHAHYFLELAEALECALNDDVTGILTQYDLDHDNMRAALRWAIEERQTDHALRLVSALEAFWHLRGYLSEGQQWGAQALALPGDGSGGPRSGALLAIGNLSLCQGNLAQAREHIEAALRLLFAENATVLAIDALRLLGKLAGEEGKLDEAITLLERAVKLSRQTGDAYVISACLDNLGNALSGRGNHERAIPVLQEAIDVACQGSLLPIAAAARWALANTLRRRGEWTEARRQYARALRMSDEIGFTLYVVSSLEGLAYCAVQASDAEDAVRLMAVAETARDTRGLPRDRRELVTWERYTAEIRAELGSARWAEIWKDSQSLGLEEAVARVLEDLAERLPTGEDGLRLSTCTVQYSFPGR